MQTHPITRRVISISAPFCWPDLFGNSVDIGPISVITLPRLIEMKLSTGRLEDAVDVVKLIKHHQLPLAFADQLAEEVREKWAEIWTDEPDHH